jgi:hypothetical protein
MQIQQSPLTTVLLQYQYLLLLLLPAVRVLYRIGTGTGTVQHSIIGHFLGAYCVLYNVQYNIWVSHAPTVEPERQLIIQEVIIIIIP